MAELIAGALLEIIAVDCIFPRARPCNPQLGASRWTSQSPNALAEESHLLLASRSRAFYCHGF
ncbi:hypothetical protein MGG_14253 [Pyricularia oryzae 70-15]|uniref:Uncharacterized protein n=1 Tax=Pyricularia oryzae (strain 70-15 / ATCC MYA-4617 / FGSC 8958) TaxID=242507 RepID=G4NBM3_PYRO7|nr:uncharacterized protein MGG_14253 [Pyricularia oryzae 70-15]EHA48128.1 hypothetical protein MGG_14253 [Pyricularia oryzae 70-15]